METLLGARFTQYSELPFLLVKGDLPLDDDQVLRKIFNENILLTLGSAANNLDALSPSPISLPQSSFGGKCDPWISPLLEKIKNFDKECNERKASYYKKSITSHIEIANFLNDCKAWEMTEIKAFLSAYSKSVEGIMHVEEDAEVKTQALAACENLSNIFFNDCCEPLDLSIFAHTFSLKEWGLIKSEEEQVMTQKAQTQATANRLAPPSSESESEASGSVAQESSRKREG